MKLERNKVYKYGYDNGKYGAEAKYAIDENGALIINLYGSNHWRDWIDNFIFWRMKQIIPYDKNSDHLINTIENTNDFSEQLRARVKLVAYRLKAHRAWYYYAFRFYRFIVKQVISNNEIFNIVIVGHSMGGAVGAILQQLLFQNASNNPGLAVPVQCYTYGAPRAFNLPVYAPVSFINKGDIVPCLPFWRPQCGTIYKSNRFIFPFWRAHIKYKMENWL